MKVCQLKATFTKITMNSISGVSLISFVAKPASIMDHRMLKSEFTTKFSIFF